MSGSTTRKRYNENNNLIKTIFRVKNTTREINRFTTHFLFFSYLFGCFLKFVYFLHYHGEFKTAWDMYMIETAGDDDNGEQAVVIVNNDIEQPQLPQITWIRTLGSHSFLQKKEMLTINRLKSRATINTRPCHTGQEDSQTGRFATVTT